MYKNPVRIWPERPSQVKSDHIRRYSFAASLFKPGVKMLDAACGVGYGTSLLWHAGHDVVGCDISEDAINHANFYFSSPAGPKFFCTDLNNVSRLETDVLICFETIEHLSNPEVFIRSLSPNFIIASVPNQLRYPFDPNVFKDDEYPHLRHYSPEDFDNFFFSLGYEVIDRFCQIDKVSSDVVAGVDGKFLIYLAQKSN